MTAKQKLIKYLAVLFAAFLIAAIALGAFSVLSSLLAIEDKRDVSTDYDFTLDISDNVSMMNIDLSSSALKIIVGDSFAVATDNADIEISEKGSVLEISQKKKFALFTDDNVVVITVPEEKVFDRVSFSAGAGELIAESLDCSVLNMELGAGDVVFNELFVSERTEINAAAGECIIRSGSINNIEMNLAVGDVNLSAALTGKAEIDCGVGDIDIILPGTENDYTIEIDKGVSICSLNGKDMKDETRYGNGMNEIEIDGGIGSIVIKTEQ